MSPGILLQELTLTANTVWFRAPECRLLTQLNTLDSGIPVLTIPMLILLATDRTPLWCRPRLLTILFTHLLGAWILIPTTGLRTIGPVPGVVLPKYTEFVSPKVTLEELIGRTRLLAMAVPMFMIGKLVRTLDLTVLPILVLTGLTNLVETRLLAIRPLNLKAPFLAALSGLKPTRIPVNRLELLARPPRAQFRLTMVPWTALWQVIRGPFRPYLIPNL